MKNALLNHFHYQQHDLDHFNWVKNNKSIVEKIHHWLDNLSFKIRFHNLGQIVMYIMLPTLKIRPPKECFQSGSIKT